MQKKLEEEKRSPNFNKAFHELLGNEGSYSNNPNDPGGETMWGVTKRVARSYGYMGSMIEMPVDTAKKIYRRLYWNDYYDMLPYIVAFNVFDAGVNHGVRRSVKFLQKSLGTAEDGIVGNNTMSLALSMNPYKLVMLFNSERMSFYTGLRSWKHFGKGWANRVAHNLKVSQ